MSHHQLTLGIIGGMGPDATVDLMQRIIKLTPAKDDQDHLRILVDNNPKIPSRIAALIEGHGPSPAAAMIKTAQGLEQAGAELLLMPCNTAHYYYEPITRSISVPMINMLECAVSCVVERYPKAKKIGILGSSALQITALYQPYFAREGIALCYPTQAGQTQLMGLIKSVKANALERSQLSEYCAVAQQLGEQQGADCLLIACTELSVLNSHLNTAFSVVDTLDSLAQSAVDRALGRVSHEVPLVFA